MPTKKARRQARKKTKKATKTRRRPPTDSENLRRRVARMRRPVPGHSYYAVTILCTEDGRLQHTTQTCFGGFVDGTPRRELRVPCEVIPEKMAAIWTEWEQPYLVVTTGADLKVFLLFGGNALVDVEVAKSHFRFATRGIEVFPDGLVGRIEAERVDPGELRKAPHPALRMAVLKRDDYKCVICGRRAADHVDVELNVHHVRPRSEAGLTKRNNLLTLCRTCHRGLKPHSEMKLFEFLPEAMTLRIPPLQETNRQYFAGVKRYRTRILEMMREGKQKGSMRE